MKIMLLLLVMTSLFSVEYSGLAENIKVDEGQILDWNLYSDFNVGYITRLTQNLGYLDAKATYVSGKVSVIPGAMFTIRKIIVIDGGKTEFACEMPASEINILFLGRIFSQFTQDRSIDIKTNSVSLTYNNK